MAEKKSEEFDEREGYCRMLGHHLLFSYCRACREGMPCYRIMDCWFEKFDVREFIVENYSPLEMEIFLQPPQPKVQTLVSLILQAKERLEKK